MESEVEEEHTHHAWTSGNIRGSLACRSVGIGTIAFRSTSDGPLVAFTIKLPQDRVKVINKDFHYQIAQNQPQSSLPESRNSATELFDRNALLKTTHLLK